MTHTILPRRLLVLLFSFTLLPSPLWADSPQAVISATHSYVENGSEYLPLLSKVLMESDDLEASVNTAVKVIMDSATSDVRKLARLKDLSAALNDKVKSDNRKLSTSARRTMFYCTLGGVCGGLFTMSNYFGYLVPVVYGTAGAIVGFVGGAAVAITVRWLRRRSRINEAPLARPEEACEVLLARDSAG